MAKFTFHFILLLAVPALGCPDSWIVVGSSCYKTSNEPFNWYDSQQYCAQQGGYLSEIRDENEQASLASFLPQNIYYWIGLTDFAQEGTWVWQTNYEEATYTAWANGNPSNSNGDEDCAHLLSGYDNYLWNDNNCDTISTGYPIHALCETANV